MTYEFFKKHNEPVLSDDCIDKLWYGNAEGFEPGFQVAYGDDPEDEETGMILTTTAAIFASVFPQYRRGAQEDAA